MHKDHNQNYLIAEPTGKVTFQRLCIPDNKFPRWDKTKAELCHLQVETEGRIEEQEGYLQMDFANKYVYVLL